MCPWAHPACWGAFQQASRCEDVLARRKGYKCLMWKSTALSAAILAAALAGCSSYQTPPTVTQASIIGGASAGVSSPPGSPAGDDRSRCGVFMTGSNVRVVVSPGDDAECQDLAKALSRDGSFWTVRDQPVEDGRLTLVCAMTNGGYRGYVEDTGGQIYGRGLCSRFLSAGWTEDTAVEDQASAQASSAARAQAAAAASAAAVQSTASASAAAADQLAKDEAAAAQLVTSIPSDIQLLAKDLSGMDGDVTKENDDLAALRRDATKGRGTSCDNVPAVTYDASQNVGYDAHQNVGYDANQNVGYHISSLRKDVSDLHDAVQRVADEGGPAPTGADSAQVSANSAISDAIAHANADIDKANSIAVSGFQIANQLATGDCSGSGPGNYQPVPHIN